MSTQFAHAPGAPGALGEDVDPGLLLRYIDDLGRWRDRRRVELDELDEAALHSPDRDALTSDVLLSMALWKAVADRHDLIVETWDSGRVLETERRRLSTLIWGRLDQAGSGGALAVSVPEACRLSDTLASSLRSRLRLEGAEPDTANRVRDLRAQVERIRDQVALVPAVNRGSAQEALIALDRRVVDVTDRARRGADVGGLLGPLESMAATTERDLIVAAAARARAKNDLARAHTLRDELAARGEAVRRLAARCTAQVTPAPRLAVPDVTALGPAPTDAAHVEAYLATLDRVDRALQVAHGAYAAALEQRDELAGRVDAYAVTAAAVTDEAAAHDLAQLHRMAQDALAQEPTPLARLAALVAAQQAYLTAWHPPAAPSGKG